MRHRAGHVGGAFGCGRENAEKAPESLRFRGKTLEGKPFDGATLARKPTVLWFWAPWCGTCRGQAPQTAKLADAYKGKANVVGVAGLDKPASMREFISAMKIGGFPQLSDERGAIWKKFEITQQSSFGLPDRNGKSVHSGIPSGPGELDERVADLMG